MDDPLRNWRRVFDGRLIITAHLGCFIPMKEVRGAFVDFLASRVELRESRVDFSQHAPCDHDNLLAVNNALTSRPVTSPARRYEFEDSNESLVRALIAPYEWKNQGRLSVFRRKTKLQTWCKSAKAKLFTEKIPLNCERALTWRRRCL